MAPLRSRMAALVIALGLTIFPLTASGSPVAAAFGQSPSTQAVAAASPTTPPSDPIALVLARQAPATTATPAASQAAANDFPSYSYMSTPPPVPSARDDNGLGLDGALGVSGDSGDNAGASGQDQGSSGISTGGIIGLSVGLFIVIVASAIITYLWYQAKKSSWAAVRQSIRTASRRVTDPIRPLTGRSAKFPASAHQPYPGSLPAERSRTDEYRQANYGRVPGQKTFLQSPAPAKKKRSNRDDMTDRSAMSDAGMSFGSDLEKGGAKDESR